MNDDWWDDAWKDDWSNVLGFFIIVGAVCVLSSFGVDSDIVRYILRGVGVAAFGLFFFLQSKLIEARERDDEKKLQELKQMHERTENDRQ